MAIDSCKYFCKDRDLNTLRALVITDAFDPNNEDDLHILDRIIDMGKIPPLEVIFTPTKYPVLLKYLSARNATILEYYNHGDKSLCIKFKSSSGFIGDRDFLFGDDDEHLLTQSQPDSHVLSRDIALFNLCHSGFINPDYRYYFDLFVVSPNDPFINNMRTEFDRYYYVSPTTFIKYADILLVEWGVFRKSSNHIIDEFMYYNDLFHAMFPKFFAFYTPANRADKISCHVESLRRRIGYIFRSLRKVQYHFLVSQGNEGVFGIEYYFGYMIMLMTGAFDSLAWIINEIHALNLSKMKIDLRKINANAPALSSKSPQLYAQIDSSRPDVCIFYPLRDSLQHRVFVMGGSLMIQTQFANHQTYNNSFIKIPKSTDELSQAIEGAPSCFGFLMEMDNSYIVEPMKFSEKLVEIFTETVNSIIEVL